MCSPPACLALSQQQWGGRFCPYKGDRSAGRPGRLSHCTVRNQGVLHPCSQGSQRGGLSWLDPQALGTSSQRVLGSQVPDAEAKWDWGREQGPQQPPAVREPWPSGWAGTVMSGVAIGLF